jgi:cytoskeletal protein RodZ
MSDHERGAYTPPTDAPLSFDARQPVRGSRPMPFTLIISVLVLLGVAAAIFVFYRSGVRQAGQAPQAVGAPVSSMKTAPPAEAQPQDPAAGLQIYKTEGGKTAPGAISPQFTPGPEQPQVRPEAAAPKVVVTPMAPAAPAPTLRPSISAQAPATAPQPPAAKVEAPAPKIEKAPAPAPAKPDAKVAKPETKPETKTKIAAAPAAKAPAAKVLGVAAVQIGAFSSQELADKGWNDAAAVAPGPAAGKGKSVEKVDVNGKTLFRTQVTGFGSRADATAFCDKLKAAGKACFVK